MTSSIHSSIALKHAISSSAADVCHASTLRSTALSCDSLPLTEIDDLLFSNKQCAGSSTTNRKHDRGLVPSIGFTGLEEFFQPFNGTTDCTSLSKRRVGRRTRPAAACIGPKHQPHPTHIPQSLNSENQWNRSPGFSTQSHCHAILQ
jgi:hypothetical protein